MSNLPQSCLRNGYRTKFRHFGVNYPRYKIAISPLFSPSLSSLLIKLRLVGINQITGIGLNELGSLIALLS